MIWLAIDTSSSVGSAALVQDGIPLETATLTSLPGHSESLLYSVTRLLDGAHLSLGEVDLLAAGVGPGSFTGLRVGLAAMKGLHHATGKPLLGVSSLLALAMNAMRQEAGGTRREARTVNSVSHASRLTLHARNVCAAIDARRGDVFAAVYRLDGVALAPFMSEQMTRPEALLEELERLGAEVICVGDAFVAQPSATSHQPSAGRRPALMPHASCLVPGRPFMHIPSDESLHFPSAANVASIAARRFERGETDNAAALEPRYVRPVDFKTAG
ncbi:MAG: tRNA (adenosine(37)-N6)-threonylcarbamoyltransferase complex dimerization subunit type 1 TsaB [Deltaproteobacteria bacterium]|nr:tRNA (adenosine(37)-N6)-threonylcarbamoyltransferase complex dimerization subunit type 1 TsaB [Deltaproteobacteria bacterium]